MKWPAASGRKDISGPISTKDHLFERVGFHGGVKYVLMTMSVPAVPEPAAGGE